MLTSICRALRILCRISKRETQDQPGIKTANVITCILALVGSLFGLILSARTPLPRPARLIMHGRIAGHLRQPLCPLLSGQLPCPVGQQGPSLSDLTCNMPVGKGSATAL